MAKPTENARRAAVASLAEAIDRRDADAAVACLSKDVVVTLPRWGGPWRGRAAVAAALSRLFDLCEQTRCVIRESHVGSGQVHDHAIIALKSSHASNAEWMVATATSTAELTGGLITRLSLDVDADALTSQWRGAGLAAASVRSEVALAGFDPDASTVTDVRTIDAVTHQAPPPAGSRTRGAVLAGALIAALAVVGVVLLLHRESSGPDSQARPITLESPSAGVTATATPTLTPTPTPAAILGPSAVAVSGGGVSARLSGTVLFDRDSAVLKTSSRALIVELASTLKNTHSGTLTVLGYTDNLGSAALGQQLSQSRADAVAAVFHQELVASGITIAAIGRGEADPVAPNDTEANRAKNRRVEIVYKP